MLFNSVPFFIFFFFIYASYLALSFNYRWQNVLLLAASYGFYGYLDWRFLILLFVTTLTDYTTALFVERAYKNNRLREAKAWFYLSVGLNLGVLGFFKYFNFFAGSVAALLGRFGIEASPFTLQVVLPAGISFYTFQTMSYTIDVYRRRQAATRKFLDFTLFVAYFPQLIAGPIERAGKLLTQIQAPRRISALGIHDGLWLFLWGLFKKVFIADNLASYVGWGIHGNQAVTSLDIYLSFFAFSLIFYCDFSGYSDMARGLSKFFGIELSRNFNLPFLSENPADFWTRWHITLSNWFRDYVYKPLRGDAKGPRRVLAVFLTMLLVGLWHGASWNFVLWGAFWGIVLVVYGLFRSWGFSIFPAEGPWGTAGRWTRIFCTYHLFILSAAFFVIPDAARGLEKLKILFTGFSASAYSGRDALTILFYIWPLLLVQWFQYRQADLKVIKRLPLAAEAAVYCLILTLLFVNGAKLDKEFLYFQF